MISISNVRKAGRVFLVTACVTAIFTLTGCQQQAPPTAPDTRPADEAAIRKAVAGMKEAVASLDAQKTVSYYTDDVVGMTPDVPLVQGKKAALNYFESIFKEKPEISWTPSHVEVARSGDLGYSWGTGKMVTKNKNGRPVVTHIKCVSVWKKQPDGSWKIAVDTMMPDPPEKK